MNFRSPGDPSLFFVTIHFDNHQRQSLADHSRRDCMDLSVCYLWKKWGVSSKNPHANIWRGWEEYGWYWLDNNEVRGVCVVEWFVFEYYKDCEKKKTFGIITKQNFWAGGSLVLKVTKLESKLIIKLRSTPRGSLLVIPIVSLLLLLLLFSFC